MVTVSLERVFGNHESRVKRPFSLGCCFGEYPHSTKREEAYISASWCCMRKRDEELVDHLLLHCPIASELWGFVFALIGVKWEMPRKVVNLLACWQGSFGHH